MSPKNIFKSLIVVTVLGFLTISDGAEARSFEPDEQLQQQRQRQDLISQVNLAANAYQQIAQQQKPGQQSELDEDEGADDDVSTTDPQVLANLPDQRELAQAAANMYNQAQYLSNEAAGQTASNAVDLKPAASKHHHHGHGAKGWLDMGAWTGKKGAFGWYDKHPVGKGK